MNLNADKRTRLVEAADVLYHKQGVNTTTLAHIAALADVPLGNVYYYFKSKESIIMAVLSKRRQIIQNQLNEWNAISEPRERLMAFIDHSTAGQEQMLHYGDVLGSLCQELSKQSGELADTASELLKDVLSWCAKQFTSLGHTDKAQTYALNLIASLQGISLLVLTLKRVDVVSDQVEFLKAWLAKV